MAVAGLGSAPSASAASTAKPARTSKARSERTDFPRGSASPQHKIRCAKSLLCRSLADRVDNINLRKNDASTAQPSALWHIRVAGPDLEDVQRLQRADGKVEHGARPERLASIRSCPPCLNCALAVRLAAAGLGGLWVHRSGGLLLKRSLARGRPEPRLL